MTVLAHPAPKIAPPPRPRAETLDELSAVLPYGGLRERYEDLALVSHPRHLAGIEVGDHTLVVACDWLAWWAAMERGLDALHLEAGLMEDAEADAERDDLFVTANAWAYDGASCDLSRFRGVSLARLFTRETSLFLLSWYQQTKALHWFLARFRPKCVRLFDWRTEFGLLPAALARAEVARACDAAGARLKDAWDAPSMSSGAFPFMRPYRVLPRSALLTTTPRTVLRAIYAAAADALTRITAAGGQGILLLHSNRSVHNLVDGYRRNAAYHPLVIAERYKKTFAFIRECMVKGVRLIRMPSDRLRPAEQRELEEVAATLAAHLAPGRRSGMNEALAAYVRQEVLRPDRLQHAARAVVTAERLLDRVRPGRVVVSDYMNPYTHEFIELAHQRGIPVDFAPHGMRTSDAVHETLVGSRLAPPMISRMLAPGPQSLTYLDRHPNGARGVCIGYPGLDKIDASPPADGARGTALVLPYSVNTEGWLNQSSFVYGALAATVRILKRRGFSRVLVKVHPGDIFNADYYRRVLAAVGLEAEVMHPDVDLPAFLAGVEMVVGPVVSGTFMETLAAGRPYYALRLTPSVNLDRCVAGLGCLDRTADLDQAIADGARRESKAVLDRLCAFSDRHPAAPHFWAAMAADGEGRGP